MLTGEPCDAKVSRTVRGGAVGKVPASTGNSLAAHSTSGRAYPRYQPFRSMLAGTCSETSLEAQNAGSRYEPQSGPLCRARSREDQSRHEPKHECDPQPRPVPRGWLGHLVSRDARTRPFLAQPDYVEADPARAARKANRVSASMPRAAPSGTTTVAPGPMAKRSSFTVIQPDPSRT